MKAKHITRLRKKAKLMQTYKVRSCWGLFGFDSFYENNYEEIRSNTPYLAMQRFFRKYYLENKRLHKFYDAEDTTTYDWGKIEVVDEKGFKTYYK